MSCRSDLSPFILFGKWFTAIQNVSKCDLFGFTDCVVSGQNQVWWIKKVWWIMLPSNAEYDSCLRQGCIYSLLLACTCMQAETWGYVFADECHIYSYSFGRWMVMIRAFFPKIQMILRKGPAPFSAFLACTQSLDGRSHHLHVQITYTVPMGLVGTQIVNRCHCRTGLFTDETLSRVLEQNVREFDSFE